MRLSHIVVLHPRDPAQKSDSAQNLLLKYRGLEMPDNPQILLTISIPQVARSLIVPEWIKESKFH